MELFRTFSHLDGTELKQSGTSYFVEIGTCNLNLKLEFYKTV